MGRIGIAPSEFWHLTCGEAILIAEGHAERRADDEKVLRNLAVIAACGPYTEEGIASLLSNGKKQKTKRNLDEEAALVLKKYRNSKSNAEG